MDKRTGFLIEELYRLGPLSNQEISRHLDLSPASVSNMLAPLVENHILRERSAREYRGVVGEHSADGRTLRRKLTFTPNPDYGYVLSGNIFGMRLEFRKIDFGLQLEGDFFESISIHADKQTFISDLSDFVESIHQRDGRQLLAIGLTVSGRVDQASQRLLYSNDLAFLIEHDIASELSSRIGIPVVLTNDANALAIHERFAGKASTVDNFFSIYINEGVGMGIYTHGHLYEGFQNQAGESGYWVVDPQGPEIPGIPRGSFESYVSRKAITHQLIEAGIETQGLNAYDVLLEHATGFGAPLLDAIARQSAHLCVNLLYMFAPELIFISGPLAEIGENYIGRLRTEISKLTSHHRRENLTTAIQLSTNWRHSMAVGTAVRALAAHLDDLVKNASRTFVRISKKHELPLHEAHALLQPLSR